jgi:phytoene desaturase
MFDLGREPAALVRLVRLGAFRRLAPTVASYFDDPRLQQIFSFQSLYAGLSPFEALAVYCVITYMDTVEGVYFPDGGMHEVARGLAAAATNAGVEVTVATPAERILRRADGSVEGLRLASGERVRADAVISTVGVAQTYRSLLGIEAPRAVRRARYSPSCIVWVAGTRGELPAGATHHNIHFGADWRGAFDALGAGERMHDPSILVSVPTATDPSLAPNGGAVLFALEPVPNVGGNVDWPRDASRARDGLVEQLGNLGYPVDDVVVDRFTDPMDWEALGHERGTPFSIAHRFFQSGPFRPRNCDHRVAGLAFAGMGTVPGVGIPMVLLSGRLAAARVESFAAH